MKSTKSAETSPPQWSPDSWRAFPIKQQPPYDVADKTRLVAVENRIKNDLPAIVSFDEIDELRKKLVEVEKGRAFILQAGDCAESFADMRETVIKNYFRLILQMNAALMCGLKKPIVRIGRIAGQFAKPRSSDVETINGKEYPAYRGDIVNDVSLEGRKPNPDRLIEAYFNSVATLNFIRALSRSSFASLENLGRWNDEFLNSFGEGSSPDFAKVVNNISEHVAFVKSCNNGSSLSFLEEASFYISHEALLLNYEECFTRFRQQNSSYYSLSAHMVWVGDRTRDLDGAHVEYLRGIKNPIGIKVGPSIDVSVLVEIIKKINPNNESGKIILIIRMGVAKIHNILPNVINHVKQSKCNVIWQIDPMHGNVIKVGNVKTRKFDDILGEIKLFFKITKDCGVYPGGVHLEATGENVTECIGGTSGVDELDLEKRYHTHCDPRLNSNQSLELAFLVGQL